MFFLEFDLMGVGNLISGSSAFSKSSLNIWKFSFHKWLKPGLENLDITLLACEIIANVQLLEHSWPYSSMELK